MTPNSKQWHTSTRREKGLKPAEICHKVCIAMPGIRVASLSNHHIKTTNTDPLPKSTTHSHQLVSLTVFGSMSVLKCCFGLVVLLFLAIYMKLEQGSVKCKESPFQRLHFMGSYLFVATVTLLIILDSIFKFPFYKLCEMTLLICLVYYRYLLCKP